MNGTKHQKAKKLRDSRESADVPVQHNGKAVRLRRWMLLYEGQVNFQIRQTVRSSSICDFKQSTSESIFPSVRLDLQTLSLHEMKNICCPKNSWQSIKCYILNLFSIVYLKFLLICKPIQTLAEKLSLRMLNCSFCNFLLILLTCKPTQALTKHVLIMDVWQFVFHKKIKGYVKSKINI
jgi:hypothetical protein